MSKSTPILIVEDNADDLLLFQLAFAKAGFLDPVFAVTDGDLAIAYLKGESPYEDRHRFPLPQLLILDLKMQRVSGFEVLSWIRESSPMKGLPVIILTTSCFAPEIRRAYELGANSFLTKPNEFNDFVRTIKQLGDYWLMQSRLPETATTALTLPPPESLLKPAELSGPAASRE